MGVLRDIGRGRSCLSASSKIYTAKHAGLTIRGSTDERDKHMNLASRNFACDLWVGRDVA